jgi:hypothetical protein
MAKARLYSLWEVGVFIYGGQHGGNPPQGAHIKQLPGHERMIYLTTSYVITMETRKFPRRITINALTIE